MKFFQSVMVPNMKFGKRGLQIFLDLASWTPPMHIGSWVGIATSDDVNRKLVSSHPSLSSMLHGERMATAPTRFTKTLSVIYIQYQFNGAAAPGNLGPSIYYSAFKWARGNMGPVCK